MALVNIHFLNLQNNYLFADIAKKVNAFKVMHPKADVISLGIGDVTQPLAPAVVEAMHRAVRALKVRPEALLIDGNRFYPFEDIPHTTIVKGDGKMMSIAAASVLAKTYRDDFMMQIDKEFPASNWRVNKGYPPKDHRAAIAKEGPCKYHRMTFRLLAVEDKTNNIFSE